MIEGISFNRVPCTNVIFTLCTGIDSGFINLVDQAFSGPLPLGIANWTELKVFGMLVSPYLSVKSMEMRSHQFLLSLCGL
jgi:hypothetical protein